MTPVPIPPLLVLVGATGAGKTARAVDLALSLGGEVIGADSVQVYRGLDVGSAKPTADELRGVRHHLLDVADVGEGFDAARFAALADRAIADVRARGRVPIVAGGTGLYVRALIAGLAEGIPSDADVRARLHARIDAGGADELQRMHDELAVVDPLYAARISPRDPIRVVRALEVHAISGEALSVHHARHAALPPRYDALLVALDVPRDVLRPRLEARAADMFARGWVDEVRALIARGVPPDARALRSVGYAQVVDHVLGRATLDETQRAVVLATTAFAKRQRTWFRGEPRAIWTPPDDLASDAWRERIRAHLSR